MQNSSTTQTRILAFEKSRISIFFQKLRVAYNILKSPQSIVIINDKIESFKHDPETVADACQNIHFKISVLKEQKESELHDNLVYQATNVLAFN